MAGEGGTEPIKEEDEELVIIVGVFGMVGFIDLEVGVVGSSSDEDRDESFEFLSRVSIGGLEEEDFPLELIRLFFSDSARPFPFPLP